MIFLMSWPYVLIFVLLGIWVGKVVNKTVNMKSKPKLTLIKGGRYHEKERGPYDKSR